MTVVASEKMVMFDDMEATIGANEKMKLFSVSILDKGLT